MSDDEEVVVSKSVPYSRLRATLSDGEGRTVAYLTVRLGLVRQFVCWLMGWTYAE